MANIGKLSGDILLFGGIYSNLPALEAVLDVAKTKNIPAERCIFTGDVVAYGADARACAERLRDFGCPAILGNCEQQLLDDQSDCGCGFEEGTACDIASKTWFEHAKTQIPDPDAFWGNWSTHLTFEYGGRKFGVVHGGVNEIAKFIWPSDSSKVFDTEFNNYSALHEEVDVIISGHSGLAFERVINSKRWINAGVIGMPPHDGRPETRYAILSDDGVRFHRLAYDSSRATRSMKDAGLTQGYEISIENGIWPSEDVLPTELRR